VVGENSVEASREYLRISCVDFQNPRRPGPGNRPGAGDHHAGVRQRKTLAGFTASQKGGTHAASLAMHSVLTFGLD